MLTPAGNRRHDVRSPFKRSPEMMNLQMTPGVKPLPISSSPPQEGDLAF
jgi:hypothetical protein